MEDTNLPTDDLRRIKDIFKNREASKEGEVFLIWKGTKNGEYNVRQVILILVKVKRL